MTLSTVSRPKAQTLTATGGAVADFPDYKSGVIYRVHTFSTSGDFGVTSGEGVVEYLIQAGGGGGGGQSSGSFGGSRGGGAGGFLQGAHLASSAEDVGSGAGVYPVAVGAGGNGGGTGGQQGADGGNSSVFGFTAVGGGGGGGNATTAGRNGGSGGGGAPSGLGTVGQGLTPRSASNTGGGGLSITSEFSGAPFLYARGGIGGSRSNFGTGSVQSLYGAGGNGARTENNAAVGSTGGPGIVHVRYVLRLIG